jgi:hypothetical protein
MIKRPTVLEKCSNLMWEIDFDMYSVHLRVKSAKNANLSQSKYTMSSIRSAVQGAYKLLKLLDKADITLETFLTYDTLTRKKSL